MVNSADEILLSVSLYSKAWMEVTNMYYCVYHLFPWIVTNT